MNSESNSSVKRLMSLDQWLAKHSNILEEEKKDGPHGQSSPRPWSDGRKLFGNGQLRIMGRPGRELKIQRWVLRERRATPERASRSVPFEELSTAENTPEKRDDADSSSSGEHSRSPPRDCSGIYRLALEQYQPQAFSPTRKTRSVVGSARDARELWMAESSKRQVVRPHGELLDAKRVAKGEAGFYKVAKMLGEGKLSHYEQDKYWDAIASGSKTQVVAYLARAEQTAMHNLTEHMRRTVAISLEKRKGCFDRAVKQEVEGFIKYLRGHHSLRTIGVKMEAQMQAGRWLFRCPPRVQHTVTVGPSQELLDVVKNTAFPGLGRFFACTTIFIGAVSSAKSWEPRIWAFAQYLASFPETVCVLFSCASWRTQWNYTTCDAWMAQARQEDLRALLEEFEPKGEAIWVAFAKVVASIFKVEVPQETWKNAVRAKRFANISTMLKSGEVILESLKTLFELVKEVSQAWAHGMSLMTWRLSSISTRLPTYAMRVSDLYLNNGVEQARIDSEVAKEVIELFREGSKYMSYVAGGGAKGGQYAAFQTVWRMVWELHESAKEYFLTHTQREEPFTIHIIGSSSIGKSVMSQQIIKDLISNLPVDYNPSSDHYFRNAEEEYWDGYRHQLVVFYDDFLQNPRYRNKECNELIKAVNPAAFPLNMARMELKGTTLFTSSFVVLTSNIDIPDDIAVADIMAVRRRRNAVIRMKVKEEYATKHGAVDVSRVCRGSCDPNIYHFTLLDPWDGSVVHETDDYSALMAWLEVRLAESGRVPKSYKQQLDEIAMEQHMKPVEISKEVQVLTEKMFEHAAEFSAVPLEPPVDSASSVSSGSSGHSLSSDEFRVEMERRLESLDGAVKESMFQRWYQRFTGVAIAAKDCAAFLRHSTESSFNDAIGFGKKAYRSWLEYAGLNIQIVTDIVRFDRPKPPLEKLMKLKTIENTIAIVVGCLSMLAVGYGVYKWANRNGDVRAIDAEQFASGDEKTKRVKKGFQVRLFDAKKMAQASCDPRALSLVRERFANAVCLVRLRKTDGSEVGVHGLLIGGKLVAVPYHFFASTPIASEIVVITNTTQFEYSVEDISVCTEWKQHDLAIIVMPNHFPSFCKLTQHFVNERDLQNMSLGHVGLLTMSQFDGYALPFFQMLQHPRRSGEHTYTSKGDETEEITIIDSIHYIAQTQAGDCGAPVVWFHPSVSRKIIGFHVAGGQNLGASNILTHELMAHIFAVLNTTQLEMPMVEDAIPTLADGIANTSQMGYYGLMARDKQFRQPAKSEIIPSKIHGEFPVITAPAALLVKDGVSPLELGVRKGCTVNCVLPPNDLAIVEEQILNHYADVVPHYGMRVLTLDEGINGLPGDPWIKPLKMKTSPGFPFITERRMKEGKKDYFTWTGDKWEASKRVKDMVERRIALASERKIPETIFVDVLKDERRELEKVEALKTRVFNTCPMDLNIAVRMYFGYLSHIVMENHITHEIAVGINYHSESWEMLYRRLRSAGSLWIAGDYSNYDKTFPRQLMMMVANIANRLYCDGNDVIRETLMETMCNRFHLANRVVYFQTHGNPSGNVLTTIINSFGNMALMRLAWLVLARQHNPRLELEFESCVALSVYGDDNVATVSRSCPWFNMNNIAKALKPFGVVYTPPKIGNFDAPDFLPADSVTYLKRYFHQYRGMILAPLPHERILETCNWIRRCADEEEATRVNVFMAQLEMFHWGHEKFDAFTRDVMSILGRHGIKPKLAPWNYFYQKYIGGTLNEESFFGVDQEPTTSAPMESEASQLPEATHQSRPGEVRNEEMVAQHQEIKNKNSIKELDSRPVIKVEVGKLLNKGIKATQTTSVRINGETLAPIAEANSKSTPKTSRNIKAKTVKVAAPKTAKNTKMLSKSTALSSTGSQSKTVLVVSGSEKQLEAPSQGERVQIGGKELIARIDEPRCALAIPLVPGATCATKLDSFARHYGWSQWVANPIIQYKSLTSLANDGIWFYRVVHDADMHALLDVANWDINSKAFVAQKSHLDFSINIPLGAMVNRRSSPQMTTKGSFVLLVYRGSEMPQGEFWLRYSVKLGGVSSPTTPSTTYKVENGVFIEPIDKSHIHGIPIAHEGHSTHYVFAPPLQDRETTQEFVRLHGGVPSTVVRSDMKAIVDKEASAGELTLTHPVKTAVHHAQTVLDRVGEVIDTAEQIAPIVTTVVRRVAQSVPWMVRTFGSLIGYSTRSSDKITLKGPFSKYNGYVTVRHASFANEELSTLASMLPIYQVASEGGDKQMRLPILPFLVGAAGLGLGVAAIQRSVKKAAQQPRIVHKGMDALSFIYDGFKLLGSSSSGDDDSGDQDNDDGIIDPDLPENPLPDVPDFGDDELAPGEVIQWNTTNRHIGGYVVDDNGTPIVKWMGATYGKLPLHISAPGPKYYSMERMPWDKESKRMLACFVEVDREMTGYYLLLQCVSWGDDSAGHWVRNVSGGTYFGTVARFGGLTEARSVIRVDDVGVWNTQPVHLLIGQSTQKYFSNDQGRACIFYLSVGAVKSGRIAQKFLAAYDSSGARSLVNTYVNDKGSTYLTSDFSSNTDMSTRSRAIELPSGLEPLAPGFGQNLVSYLDGGGSVSRTLPIAIEAGPIRGILLARYDEANGWWQHVPYCAISYTSLSARWKCVWLMGDEGTESRYVKATDTRGASVPAVRVTPPSVLTSNAYCCVEVFTLSGNNNARASVYDTSGQLIGTSGTSRQGSSITTPISNYRVVFPAQTFDIVATGDTSRPTTAVAGRGGDEYLALNFTVYLLKDYKACQAWVRHEQDVSVFTDDNVTGSAATENFTHGLIKCYKCDKDTTGAYMPTLGTVWCPVTNVPNEVAYAPLTSKCPLYSAGGRMVNSIEFCPKPWLIPPKPSPDVAEPPPTSGVDVSDKRVVEEPPASVEEVDVSDEAPRCCARCQAP